MNEIDGSRGAGILKREESSHMRIKEYSESIKSHADKGILRENFTETALNW